MCLKKKCVSQKKAAQISLLQYSQLGEILWEIIVKCTLLSNNAIAFFVKVFVILFWVTVISLRTHIWNGCGRKCPMFVYQSGGKKIETVAQNLLLINDYFKTISSHFLGSYINIFHKKEIQTVIWGWKGLYLNWFVTYVKKRSKFYLRFLPIL